ncbi:MAG: 50S ribosomal protein L20 [Parcubacteria group bacterium]|nr:50S ribosomal protein L20 [Parcubacteria group bacterium]
MTRVKRGTTRIKSRRNTLKQAKGYRFGRSKKVRQAHEAIAHAGVHAFGHRRKKKKDFRRLWQVKINAATREYGNISYSQFIFMLKQKGIGLDRKSLADLAENNPEIFKKVLEKVK